MFDFSKIRSAAAQELSVLKETLRNDVSEADAVIERVLHLGATHKELSDLAEREEAEVAEAVAAIRAKYAKAKNDVQAAYNAAFGLVSPQDVQ